MSYAIKFSTLAGLVVNNLKSPDIIALEEVQDNNGDTDDSVIDATNTYNMLISAIRAAGDRMLTRALTANLPAKWVTGDMVYGNDS